MRVVKSVPTPDDIKPHAGVGQWFIDDPQSHPVWKQYSAILMHLRPVEGLGPPHMHGKYSHEWQIYAIDPDHPLPETFKGLGSSNGIYFLTPMNYGYQFHADNDAAAMERVEKILVEAPSLDTDYRQWWDGQWRDAHPLVR